MLLSGPEIRKQMDQGNIIIDPFINRHLGSNSYDVTLSPRLRVYETSAEQPLDMFKDNQTKEVIIPETGLILTPGILYLGATNETATSSKFAPMFEGRSSVGRLGIHTHITAGFGDVGWGFIIEGNDLTCTYPTWTLEIAVVQPVRIYPNVRIGQVYFFEMKGDQQLYQGKYHNQKDPQSSRFFEDYERTVTAAQRHNQ